MDITQAGAPGAAAAASPTKQETAISSDFETFLKLLTSQISNQDPMDPMKAEEFSVQLATFSGVEQQVKTNDLLEKMIGGDAGGDFAAMSSWIGKEARAAMPVRFSGEAVTLDLPPAEAGDRHQMVVRSADGAELDRMDVSGEGGRETWSGRLGGDGMAPSGTYSFEIQSFDEMGSQVATSPVGSYARVTEVRSSETGPVLVFQGGAQVPAAEVTALREPTA